MKKFALYPFTDQYQLLNSPILKDGRIQYIIPALLWTDRVVDAINRNNYDVDVLLESRVNFNLLDVLVVLPISDVQYENSLVEFIYDAIDHNIEVYCYHNFKTLDIGRLIKHDNFTNKIQASFCPADADTPKDKLEINAPVIFNFSLIDGYYHSEVDLFLYNKLKGLGASVGLISCNPLADLYGGICFPITILYEQNFTTVKNWAIKFFSSFEQQYHPDVIIISLQESINPLPFGDNVMPFANCLLSSMISSDYKILSMYGKNMMDESINWILSKIKCLIGDIDSTVLLDIVYDVDDDGNYLYYRCDEFDSHNMYNTLKHSTDFIYPIDMYNSLEKLVQRVLLKITRERKKQEYERYL